MSSVTPGGFAPREIAANMHLRRRFRRLKRWFRRCLERLVLARRYGREIDLLHVDNRMLKDIGLTRGDVTRGRIESAAVRRWWID